MSEKDPPSKARRDFGSLMLRVGWASVAVTTAGAAAATWRFAFPGSLTERPLRFFAGRPEDYAAGEVSERFADEEKVWIVRDHEGLYALVAECPHLGCRPRWFADEQRFKCPCHGSNFDRAGRVLAGPAPRPLKRAALHLTRDGRIEVDRSRTAPLGEANGAEFRIALEAT